MAQLVGTFVSSHAPMMAASVESAPPEQRRSFLGGVEEAARRVREQGAEAVVICSNEHFTNFFLENFPQFCVGVGASHWGPVEPWLKIDHGEIPGAPELAAHLAGQLPAESFEPSFSHELRLDHGIMTVYHAIDPTHQLPLVPFIQNCAVKPMPTLRRCYQLGQAIRRVLEGFSGAERVAVVGAGGLSHWIGVPRVGQIDVEFDHWFLDRLERGQLDDVLDLPDAELELAGNGAHEIRSWLTIAGLAAPSTAKVLAYEPITPWITGMGVVAYDLEPSGATKGPEQMELIGHVIGGEEVPASDGATFDSIDPWTRQPWARVARGTREDVDSAVAAARMAFDQGPWPRMGYERRGRLLHRLGELIEAHVDELARADTTDMGKPISVMREADVPRAARNFHFFADHARLRPSEVFPMDSGHHAYVRYDPAGVVVAIAPWNFPLMLETWKVAPALAWGNTVVLKPAEDSPASATLLARLAMEAGFPEGVLNVVHGFGPDAAGQWLTESPRVDRITFTGESATGRAIARAAAGNLVPVSMELGGKGANLVFADADLDVAVPWSIRAIFSNSGQVCLAGSRLFVERGIYDEFMGRFVAAADAMVLGDPARDGTQLGPLASETHYRKVTAYLDTIPADGGKILTGGATGDGWFVRPTIAVDLPASARACREEIFGPVVTVTPFDGEDEGVELANDTPYGLNAMLFTESLRRAHQVSAALQAGTVWVNCFFIRDLRAPFGGVGDSGWGREGGDYSREFCTEPKAVVMDI